MAATVSPPSFASVFTGADENSRPVLQRGETVRVWGTAEPTTHLTLTTSSGFATSTASDREGRWTVFIPPQVESWSQLITISGSERASSATTTVHFGEVVLCS